jgi:hypothetical protein
MRPVGGFERPALQWAFVACSAALIALAIAETVTLWRLKSERDSLRVAELNGRVDRQQLEIVLARERSARETLSSEVGRRNAAGEPSVSAVPTLTLAPLRTRAVTPPQATMDPPRAAQVVELRVQLPRAAQPLVSYTVALRRWSTGEVLWTRSGLVARDVEGRPTVTTYVTGDLLAPGAYEVALTGVGKDGHPSEVAGYEIAVRSPR